MLKATKFAPLLLLAVLFGCGEGDGGGGGSAPVINSFSANPATIAAAGQTVQLRWSVSGNPTGLSIDNGVGTVSGNSVNVTPSATTIASAASRASRSSSVAVPPSTASRA